MTKNNIEKGIIIEKEPQKDTPIESTNESEKTPEEILKAKLQLEGAEKKDKDTSAKEIEAIKRQLNLDYLKEAMVKQEIKIQDAKFPGWREMNAEKADEIAEEKFNSIINEERRIRNMTSLDRIKIEIKKTVESIGRFFFGE